MDMTLLGDMAMLCADRKTMDLCASALALRKLRHRVRKKSGEYRGLARMRSGDDHEGRQRAGVPRGGATRCGAHACGGGG